MHDIISIGFIIAILKLSAVIPSSQKPRDVSYFSAEVYFHYHLFIEDRFLIIYSGNE